MNRYKEDRRADLEQFNNWLNGYLTLNRGQETVMNIQIAAAASLGISVSTARNYLLMALTQQGHKFKKIKNRKQKAIVRLIIKQDIAITAQIHKAAAENITDLI